MTEEQEKRIKNEFEMTRYTIRARSVPWWIYYIILVAVCFIGLRACGG